MTVNACGVKEVPYSDGILVYRKGEVTLTNLSVIQVGAVRSLLSTARDASPCQRRKVGAVLLAADGSMISVGLNAVVNGETCERCPLSQEQVASGSDHTAPGQRCPAIHAEESALVQSGYSEVKPVLTIVTEEPCDRCADLLARFNVPWYVWPRKLPQASDPEPPPVLSEGAVV